MSRFTKWAIIPTIALALVLTTNTSRADAGGFSINIGSGGFGPGFVGHRYGGGYRYGSGFRGYGGGFSSFNYGHRAFGPAFYPGVSTRYGVGYRGYVQPSFQYRAPVVTPYRGHYHYQPQHYNYYGRF